jgi:D-sedoheptulose 7-phosphate isomerase
MKNIDLIKLYKEESKNVFDNIDEISVDKLISFIWDAYQHDNCIFACGNGGNAGFVGNLVSDLSLHPFVCEDKSKKFKSNKRLRVIDLCVSNTSITGLMNDLGPDHIFSGQLEVHGRENDVVIGFSGSGNSKNILESFKVSKARNMKTVLLTKNKKGKCAQHSDLIIEITGNSNFPGQTGKNNNNFHFEDCLSKITHIVTGIFKKKVQDL